MISARSAELDRILSVCISCGYCLPVCLSYQLTGDEASSPRGRISLMRAVANGHLPADDETVLEQSSFCLGCRACESVCPAGVPYGELLEEWRADTWKGRKPLRAQLLSALVRWSLPIRTASWITRPATARNRSATPTLMLGCFERLLSPGVSRVVARLVPDLQVDPSAGCCGALRAHNGDPDQGREMAERLGTQISGTIITPAGGCAAHLASVIGASRVRELSQWIVDDGALDLDELRPITIDDRPARIAIQDSCHL